MNNSSILSDYFNRSTDGRIILGLDIRLLLGAIGCSCNDLQYK